MRHVSKVLAVLSIAAGVAPAVNAAQPSDSNGNAVAPVANAAPFGGPAYGAPGYVGPYAYGPAPYYGPGYWGGPWGHGGGSGRVRISFDFDGLADGWVPWRGWWW